MEDELGALGVADGSASMFSVSWLSSDIWIDVSVLAKMCHCCSASRSCFLSAWLPYYGSRCCVLDFC